MQKHRATIVGFVSLVLPAVLLWYHGKDRPEATVYQRTLSRIASPAQDAVGTVVGAARDVWLDYIWLVGVQQDNREFVQRNAVLSGMVQDRDQLKKENKRLKALLAYKGERPDLVTIAARIVAKDVSPFHRVLKVKVRAGAADGVRRYQAVVTPNGVVGHVERVVGGYADVKLAVDAGSRISVNVADRDVKGVVAGSGDKNDFLASFETSDPKREVRPGDMLVTNGEDERYPKGLVVGTIRDLPGRPAEAGLLFEVEPAVNYGTLDEILIVTSTIERIPTEIAP